jgi:hypothetical protein
MSGLGTTNPSYEIRNAIIIWEARRGPAQGEEKGAEKETAGVLVRCPVPAAHSMPAHASTECDRPFGCGYAAL